MIKEKLMNALKIAAADYNGGMSANLAVACAAEAYDFNEKQAERLVEMFNTSAALTQEKSASDPAGSCELASKDEVLKILLGGNNQEKTACVNGCDYEYSFYSSVPSRTNPTIESRSSGFNGIVKAASSDEDATPEELKVSQRSLYKIISSQIDMLKSAAAAADDVVRNLWLAIEEDSIKVAKEIESPYAHPDAADMFKAACKDRKAIDNISEYSTKVAESDGGRFSRMNVFDASPIEGILKIAEDVQNYFGMVSEYERKRDFYLSKAAEAEREMMGAVGIVKDEGKNPGHDLADMFIGVTKKASPKEPSDDPAKEANICMRLAGLLRESGSDAESVIKLAENLEKDAAFSFVAPLPSFEEATEAMSKTTGVDDDQRMLLNVRRSIIIADLMSNDPIIRDADPNVVTEAYRTMIMTSPRVSLDKSQVRAFLRSAVNSVAISPNDAKVIADVDKGMSLSNVDRLTSIDSSIKDSNE